MSDEQGKPSLPLVHATAEDALERLAAGETASVIAELKVAVERRPDEARAWLRLGTAYLAIAHAREAAEALAHAVRLDDADLDARLCFADALARSKRHDEAAYQLVQARRLAPNDARVHRQLGVAFFDKGLCDKALGSLARALELDPSDARAHFVSGLVHDARRESALAAVSYRRAIALDESMVDARCTLADALAAMGELDLAVRELEAAQRLDRTNLRLAQNLEVLRGGLRELAARRLFGKSESVVEQATLVTRGGLMRRGPFDTGLGSFVRYEGSLVELWAHYSDDAEHVLDRAILVVSDPERALRTMDDALGVTVMSPDGKSERADVATAAALTLLRELLGCSLTRASAIYAELIASSEPLELGGATLSWVRTNAAGKSYVGLAASPLGPA